MISVCLLISLYTSWITLSCLCKTGRKRKNRLSHGILKCKKTLHNCTVFGHVMIIFVLSVKQLNTLSHFKSLYLDENVSRIFFIFFLYLTKILKKNQTKKAHTVLPFLSFFAILPKAQGVNKVQTSSFN